MTPWDLQKSLIAEIEELLAQMQLKNAAGEDVFGVKGYEQRLPEIADDEEDQSQFFPYFIVRIEEGNTPTDDEPWLVGTTVLFGICDYDKETNGHRTILEMITTLHSQTEAASATRSTSRSSTDLQEKMQPQEPRTSSVRLPERHRSQRQPGQPSEPAAATKAKAGSLTTYGTCSCSTICLSSCSQEPRRRESSAQDVPDSERMETTRL